MLIKLHMIRSPSKSGKEPRESIFHISNTPDYKDKYFRNLSQFCDTVSKSGAYWSSFDSLSLHDTTKWTPQRHV